MSKIAIIACVKEKHQTAMPAIDLYCSDEFKKWLLHAKQLQPDTIYILSGKYGLILPETIIEPYDLNLNEADESYHLSWSREVIQKLEQHHDLKNDQFIFYTNKHYAEHLLPLMNKFEFPFINE